MANNLSKNMVFASFGAAGFVALLALLDMILAFPFGSQMTMDIMFILSAGIVAYLAWDAYKDLG